MAKKPKGKTKPQGFVFFDGASLERIRAQLNAGPVQRLEVRGQGKDTTIWVVYEGPVITEGGGGTNDAHVCPGDPLCPK